MALQVGGLFNIIRIVGGLGILVWGFVAGNWWGAIGAIPLVMGAVNYCPLRNLFGAKSCCVKK